MSPDWHRGFPFSDYITPVKLDRKAVLVSFAQMTPLPGKCAPFEFQPFHNHGADQSTDLSLLKRITEAAEVRCVEPV